MANNSLLYLHKKNTATTQIKKDFDYLIDLSRKEGLKQKRWNAYRNDTENAFEDGDAASRAAIMEHLAFKESVIEGLDEEKILMLMWVGRFHDLFNLVSEQIDVEHESANVFKNLKSGYVKKMLAKTFSIVESRKNLSEDNFDYVDFFDSLEGRSHLDSALRAVDKKHPDDWNILFADIFLDHLLPVIKHGKKYRSASVYLQRNGKKISDVLENNFSHQNSRRSDNSLIEFEKIKKIWNEFYKN